MNPGTSDQQQSAASGMDERFNAGVGTSGNTYAGNGGNGQGYYYQDANHGQFADAGFGQSAYAQQQQMGAYNNVSGSQPYWYTHGAYPEGANGAGVNGGTSNEVSIALRDRDVKTQRRKEANRESARRSKQRKKEESELLSSKAQELVKESVSLRAKLEKVQKQADKLYAENMELREQVMKSGGSLPPSPERVVPMKLPPPIELPASLLKDVDEAATRAAATKKDQSESPASKASKKDAKDTPAAAVAKSAKNTEAEDAMMSTMRSANEVFENPSEMGIPGLLTNEANVALGLGPSSTGAEAGGMMDRDNLFGPNGAGSLEDDVLLRGALRHSANFPGGKSFNSTGSEEDFIHRSDVGQGG